MNEELKEICSSEGVNNYLSKRNLKINNNEQNIINSKNEKIGKFMVVYEDISDSESLVIDIKNPIFNLNKKEEGINVDLKINPEMPSIESIDLNNNNDEFNLHFKYKKKEVVLYIKSNMKFSEIKSELLKNYESFRNIKIIGFLYNNKMINYESTCEELNIKSDSKIIIIEE